MANYKPGNLMQTTLKAVAMILAMAVSAVAGEIIEQVEISGGRTLEQVTVVEKTGSAVRVKHRTGTSNLTPKDLTIEAAKQLGVYLPDTELAKTPNKTVRTWIARAKSLGFVPAPGDYAGKKKHDVKILKMLEKAKDKEERFRRTQRNPDKNGYSENYADELEQIIFYAELLKADCDRKMAASK